jgi:hypothetical protein
MSEDPVDEISERAIKKEKNHDDPYANSIDPPGLEGTGLGKNDEEYDEFVKGEDRDDPEKPVGRTTFERLSSDKEEDTTEGEITDDAEAD